MAVDTAVKPSLTLKRRLKAPPAKVFAAWTDPEKIKRWMGPGEIRPSGPTPTHASAAATASRCARLAARRTMSAASIARWSPNEKLVFTWAWDAAPPDEPHELLVTVLFKPDDGGTLLTLTHEHLFDEEIRARSRRAAGSARSTSSKKLVA